MTEGIVRVIVQDGGAAPGSTGRSSPSSPPSPPVAPSWASSSSKPAAERAGRDIIDDILKQTKNSSMGFDRPGLEKWRAEKPDKFAEFAETLGLDAGKPLQQSMQAAAESAADIRKELDEVLGRIAREPTSKPEMNGGRAAPNFEEIPKPEAPSNVPASNLQDWGEEDWGQDELEQLGRRIGPAGKKSRDTYGFADQYNFAPEPEKDTYDFKKPTARPVGKPVEERIPLADSSYGFAEPDQPKKMPLPRANPISDSERSREQWTGAGAWKDLKGYLPSGLGNHLGKKKDDILGGYKAASEEAAAGGAGRAGAMAAGVGEAAMAAGPAAILLAVELGTKAVVAGFGKLEHGIDATGQSLARFAAGDSVGLLDDAFKGVTGVMDEMGPATQIFSAELKVAAAGVRAFTAVADSFVKRGREIAPYQGNLAMANANADIRRLQADMREAQTMGKTLAQLTDADSRIEIAIRDAALPIRAILARLVTGVEEKIAGAIERLVPLMEKLAQAADFWYRTGPKLLVDNWEAMDRGWTRIYDELSELVDMGRKHDAESSADDWQALERMIANLKRGPGNPPPPKRDEPPPRVKPDDAIRGIGKNLFPWMR